MFGTCPWILRKDFNMWWSLCLGCWLTSRIIGSFLTAKSTFVDHHPPYPPNFACYDFFLFPRMKLQLWRFVSRMSQKFRINLWLPYVQFTKVSSIGSCSGPVAWTGEGASMKGMTLTSNKDMHIFHYQLNLGTAGYSLTQSAAFN
jgi:hypothetical protein